MLDIQTKNIILEKIPSYKGLARYHDSGQQIPLTKWNPPLKTTCLPDSSVETASIISGCATVALGVASFAISPHTWAPVSLVALGGFLASGGIIYKNREEISEAASNLVDSRLSEEEQKIKTAYQTLGVDPIAEMHVVEAVYKREKRNAENEKRLEDVQKFDEAFYKINEYKDRIEREKLLYDHSNINE
uniref:Uncharacterized protein n=1 Tax=Acrobeloides nanus TaxID=290746 RepID=A0A914E0K9_9BILA